MIFGYYSSLPIIMTVGTVYPLYQTYKAVMSREEDTMVRWLQYWVLYTLVTLLMPMVDIVGEFLPLYYEAKIAFALWLVHDSFKGATFLFDKHLKPVLETKEKAIDEQLDFAFKKVKALKVDDLRILAEWAQTQAKGVGAKGVAEATVAAKKSQGNVKGKASASPSEQVDKPQEPQEPEEPEVVEAEADEPKKEQ